MRDLEVVVVQVHAAKRADRERGLLAWVTLVLDGLWQVDGVTVRESAAGRLAVFFPERIDQSGHRHRVIWPVAPWARRHVEREVLRQATELLARRERVIAS